ncbi:hypothetical protein SETIT_1G243000v2 [Setaria italica]|uniref:F-box domain-containing protein n=1 Tax=Setaria italica TaxID=4555 RepID=K3YY14_SETIT|nr:hypothetical protein SETIT_1G243000v2 [Setaria italica]
MAPPRPWADLPLELVSCIADRLKALRCYLAARGVSKAWRSALESASPYVVRVCRIRVRAHAVAVSIPLRRSFHLTTINSYSRCVGSCHGWLAIIPYLGSNVVLLMNPLTGKNLKLVLPLLPTFQPPHRIVFAPNPSVEGFTAVATWVAGANKLLAYVRIRNATCSFELIPVDTPTVHVVYHAGEGGGGGKFYCLLKNGEVRVLRVPRDLQATPVLEPLLDDGVPSGPTDIFAPPFSRLPEHTLAKHLRNTGGAMNVEFPGGGSLHMSKNEVFVLRHASASVSVGLSNAVSVHAEGMAGMKGNCVYWVGPSDFAEAMAFDMETKRSTRLHRDLLRCLFTLNFFFLSNTLGQLSIFVPFQLFSRFISPAEKLNKQPN